MRTTLRRSCNACAKAKLGCDLRIPQCSRCIKRNSKCVYANKPLNSPLDAYGSSKEVTSYSPPAVDIVAEVISVLPQDGETISQFSENPAWIRNPATASFDPFDSYPPTRLPRLHVQRLIHRFLSSIAFQYYPLDLNMESNPFIVSWWPLALADQALFHVSLQTASLYEELQAQKGFPISDLLMVDSIALVRRRIEDSSLAFQDETLDSVVTLAAIEHGKGNIEASRMHIDGVKRMVGIRGGIDELKQRSPLTARMVSWVSMLVMEAPQFPIKDDSGYGDGISAIPQWQLVSADAETQDANLDKLNLTSAMSNILSRLRNIFHHSWHSSLTNAQLHDLTCFVMHKLLLLPPCLDADANPVLSAASECLRYATALYMLILHGTTYYSHVGLANAIILQLKGHLTALLRNDHIRDPLGIWAISVGMVATVGTRNHEWFTDQASMAAAALGLKTWEVVLTHLQSILWVRVPQEELFRQEWEEAFKMAAKGG
ncbi:hypothetical protein CFAM422_010526 [Trichoderma lentiforme]|uniref:Zn(2)-C6 fungal-type domain-containing protein n=1 Tax=Trichoderma lentiforme TaxID=1567552 RepID=A0A9P4X8M2_9HYPO|nr:hypothetical protein CFAM422_010526 [Trichoderma lentiforme]